MAHVSSVKIDTGMLLSDVLIETSGGAHPISLPWAPQPRCLGMKDLIERYQTAVLPGFRGPRPDPLSVRLSQADNANG